MTAIHEAGHAVACIATGTRVRRVTVRAREGYLGLCTHEETRCRRDLHVICLAGPVAEVIAFGRHTVPEDATDFITVRRDVQPRRFDEIWAETTILLQERWPLVERLGDALLAEKLLFGARVRELAAMP